MITDQRILHIAGVDDHDETLSIEYDQLTKIEASPDSAIAGQHLDGVDLPEGSLVISGAGGERTAISETRLEADERYIVAADPDVSNTVISASRSE